MRLLLLPILRSLEINHFNSSNHPCQVPRGYLMPAHGVRCSTVGKTVLPLQSTHHARLSLSFTATFYTSTNFRVCFFPRFPCQAFWPGCLIACVRTVMSSFFESATLYSTILLCFSPKGNGDNRSVDVRGCIFGGVFY